MHRLVFLLLSFLLILPVSAHGGNCACSSFRSAGIGGPIITIPAYTIPKGVTSIGFGLNYLNRGRLNANQIAKVRASDAHADDLHGSLIPSLSINHGLTDRLSLALSMPFRINWDLREVGDEGVEELGESIGFGDLVALGQYKFMDLARQRMQASLLGGIKFPTGPSNIKGNTGERVEAIHQPGSGSFDPMFGIALSKLVGRFGLDFNFLYTISTLGRQDTIVGDTANYNFAISYAVNHDHGNNRFFEHSHSHEQASEEGLLAKIFPQHLFGQHLAWDLILEAATNWEKQPIVSDVRDVNHGGTAVFLNPGVRVTVNDSWVYNLSVGFPVIENLNGEQGGTDLQILFGVATVL